MLIKLEAREFDWEIAPGRVVRGFGFNGQVPGPLITVQLGQRLVVELTNTLPEPTTIHWHGLRIPAAMDGTESVQRAVQPGETFEYSFVPPDAGTFWYHSHVNETEQVERGLYGALIVRSPDDPELDAERILLLDDLKLDEEGELAPFGDPHEHHAGREGDLLLVNGRNDPQLEMAAGQMERWRVVNVANTRFMRLSIGAQPFAIIGSDGGLLPAPVRVREVLITAGERVDLAVGPFREGEEIAIEALSHDRGKGETAPARLARLRARAPEPSNAEIPEVLRRIEPLVAADVEPTRMISMKTLMHAGHGQKDEPVRVGDLQVWELVNETGQDHPFHLHGFFFQVLDDDGPTAWKDTVNVPRKQSVRIAWVPDDRPGAWMYHCHILEHHAMGMMAHFDVVR